MDALIKRFDRVKDADLAITRRGVAYQRDMSKVIEYDETYFKKCASYDPNISESVNAGRAELVARHYQGELLDVGIGAGDFVSKRENTKGFDVNPSAVEWLKSKKLYSEEFSRFCAFTFWDVIEHVEEPEIYFKHIAKDSYAFFSIPVFKDLNEIRKSKHYRPGEHLYYWTEEGFVQWMALYGFRLLEVSHHEIDAGRKDILAFAFKRDLPGFREYVSMYSDIHATRYYGASAKLYLDNVAKVVKDIKPKSILDYGCGRSDLVCHFWMDGERRIERYDPAIPDFKSMPVGRFDLVLCCDVMEHIPMLHINNVFREIKSKSDNALFVISTIPSRAKLPNGDNAHITLLTKDEWKHWIDDVFGSVTEIETQWDHVLMVKT